jgi:hypothetical protein
LAPAGDEQQHELPPDRPLVIGSDSGCDVVLPDGMGVQVEIGLDDRDEFVVDDLAGGVATVDGRAAHGLTLHTGDRLQIGPWEAVFQRDEASDHGRPYGGRQGGEGSHQPPQPARPADQDAPGRTG